MIHSDSPYIVPVTLERANNFVKEYHPRCRPFWGRRFAIGCAITGELVGVAIIGLPLEQVLADGQTLAVNYIYTTAGAAAYGALYGAAARAAKAMGYYRIIAYLPENVPGSGLRAIGWRCTGSVESTKPQARKKLRYEQRLILGRQKREVMHI